MSRRPTSAIPAVYYAIFGIYEPLLTVVGCFGAMADPKRTHDSQAPWPNNNPPTTPLPTATLVTILQLAHVCALVGLVNLFVLRAVRKHLASQPALQETIVTALLTPLLFGDVVHVVLTLWALDPSERWAVMSWSPLLSLTVFAGLSLLLPRLLWHLGVGRYVHRRDSSGGGLKVKEQ